MRFKMASYSPISLFIMTTISRKEAKALGLRKYVPGTTCKHGHIAARYTSTGACEQCVRGEPNDVSPFSGSATEMLEALRQRAAERAHGLGMLAEIKLWAHCDDIAEIRETAVACCLGVFPALEAHEVRERFGPTAISGDMGQYRVRVPDQYIAFMRDLSNAHMERRKADAVKNDQEKTRAMLDDLLRSVGRLPKE